MFLLWIVVWILSVHSSSKKYKSLKNEAFIDGNEAGERLLSTMALGRKVLSSTFDLDSAKEFAKSATDLISEVSLTKQELIAIDLASEMILHHLKTGNHFEWSKEGRLKAKIKKLIKLLREKSSVLENSNNQFFVHLGYRVYQDLKNYRLRLSKISMETLALHFRHYEKVLQHVYDQISLASNDSAQNRLEILFAAGYDVLSSFSQSFNSFAMDKFLESLYTLFIDQSNQLNFTRIEITAIESQCAEILNKLLAKSHSSYSHELRTDIEIIQRIHADAKLPFIEDDMSVSFLVVSDLQHTPNFDTYDDSLKFLSSNVFHDQSLRNNLLKSVKNRHHIVPDYDDKLSISNALIRGKYEFDSVDERREKIGGFYFLTKLIVGELHRAEIAFKTLSQGEIRSVEDAVALWMIGKESFKSEDELDWFPADVYNQFKEKLPKNKEEYVKGIADSKEPIEILLLIAVNVITEFSHPLIHLLIEEFDKKEYQHFCPGADQLRDFLKFKAKWV
jgi:hypothetical protein